MAVLCERHEMTRSLSDEKTLMYQRMTFNLVAAQHFLITAISINIRHSKRLIVKNMYIIFALVFYLPECFDQTHLNIHENGKQTWKFGIFALTSVHKRRLTLLLYGRLGRSHRLHHIWTIATELSFQDLMREMQKI